MCMCTAAAGAKRRATHLPAEAPAKRRVTPENLAGPSGQHTASQQHTATAGAPAASQPAIIFQQEPQLHAELGKETLPHGDAAEAGSRVVEAVLRGNQWEVVCSSSGAHQWTDQVAGKVVAVGGSMRFAAVAFEGGTLQVSLAHTPTVRCATWLMHTFCQLCNTCCPACLTLQLAAVHKVMCVEEGQPSHPGRMGLLA